ncbi:GGDEF domain-containing protein [Longilinea arvoryzae]|nr:diguanylate cyclase [Longilinea arvoryzae]
MMLLCALVLAAGLVWAQRQQRGADRPAGQILAQNASEGLLLLDGRGRVIYHNPAAQAIFGAESLHERPLVDLLAVWWQPALQLLEEGQIDFECTPREGSFRLRILALPARNRGTLEGRALILTDLSRQRGLERRLEALETTDVLTGLANRPRLLEMASREVYRARRYHRALSVVMIQVDDFSALCDRFGYAAGEQVMQCLAQRCRENIRLADSLGRWGEDTFTLLLPETGLEQGCLAAERIRRILSGLPISTQRGEVCITLSAGVAGLSDAAPVAADQLLDQAAAALFAASCRQAAERSLAVVTVGAPAWPAMRQRREDRA